MGMDPGPVDLAEEDRRCLEMASNGPLLRMSPTARLLDLTRLTRRAGQVLTGVDRVELAYAEALSAAPEPCWGIIRTSLGYALLPPDAVPHFAARAKGAEPWPTPRGLSHLSRRLSAHQKGALTFVRSAACARTVPQGLTRMLRKQLPEKTDYFNVGHSNLTQRMLTGIGAFSGRSLVFVHDVIPREFPQYQRPGSVQDFEAKMQRVQAHADAIIVNSTDTGERAAQMMAAVSYTHLTLPTICSVETSVVAGSAQKKHIGHTNTTTAEATLRN